MAKKREPILRLDLGANGGEVRFRSAEEIKKWISHEITFWQWLQKCTSYDSVTETIWSQHATPWNEINERIGRFKSISNDQEKSEQLKAIENILTGSYKTGKSLHSSTPQAKKLLEYNRDETDQNAIVTATYMLGYFIGAPFTIDVQRPASIATVIKATQEAMLFERGITGISDSERAALYELHETHNKLNNELADQINETKEFLKATDNDFKVLYGTLSEKFAKLYKSSEADVKYWTDKAEKHRNLSIGFGLAFILTLIGVGYYGFQEVYALFRNVSPSEKLEYWAIALIIISAVVGISIVRLIVGVMLNHIHLQRESSERATMVLTYLALLREGSELKDDEKKLILQALFKPGAAGSIKDNAIPPSIYDFIMKRT